MGGTGAVVSPEPVPTMRRRTIAETVLELVQGDITQQDADAVVNAANTTLLGGGGVDGAIHRAGGPAILVACRSLGGCDTGDAKLTPGGRLRARFVIHAVGPVYRDGRHGEPALLASAYRRSLEVAIAHGLRSVAFPSLSTGAYRYPIALAAPIALDAVAGFVTEHAGALEVVRFILFTTGDLAVYEPALAALVEPARPRGA